MVPNPETANLERKMKPFPGISIRPAKDMDSENILNLLFNIWINEYHFDVKREDFPDLLEIEKSYADLGGLFLIASHKDQIIGTIACQKLSDIHFVLKRMFVDKKFRGLGIAQLLLDNLLKEVLFLREIQNVAFYLSTKENEAIAAKRFYLKNEFQVIPREELPESFPFFYEDDLFMKRQF